jgi:hypothetical protein
LFGVVGNLKQSVFCSGRSQDDSTGLVDASPAQREEIRKQNEAAQRAWERDNPELVAEHRRVQQANSGKIDEVDMAKQLRERGLIKKEAKALDLAGQIDVNKATKSGNGRLVQEVGGRVVEFKVGKPAPVDTTDICVTNPETCRGNLGVPRWAMPQFKAEGAKSAFLEEAKKMGYEVDRRAVRIGDLGVTQSQILESKADRMAASFTDQKDGKKALKEYERRGIPVIGGDVLDGHHHYAAALRTAGPDTKIATDWVYKTDQNGNEVPMSRADKEKLWKASINTKGVTREDLAPGGAPKAEITRAFIARGKDRTRKGQEGYDFRREWVTAKWDARHQPASQSNQSRPGNYQRQSPPRIAPQGQSNRNKQRNPRMARRY